MTLFPSRDTLDERKMICAFLRKYTQLRTLAVLLELGAHRWSENELRTYCAGQGILLSGDGIEGA